MRYSAYLRRRRIVLKSLSIDIVLVMFYRHYHAMTIKLADRALFRSKTLLVVGAGASCEADLPSGKELKGQIANAVDIEFSDVYNQTSGDLQIAQALLQHVDSPHGRFSLEPYLQAGQRIKEAMPQAISIDNYIDAHHDKKEVELVGKLGIAQSILAAEGASKLRRHRDLDDGISLSGLNESWYILFGQLLHEGVSLSNIDAIFDNVEIITFNYDRCIEHFLLHSLVNYYHIDKGRSAEILSRLRIYHPYGSVGRLPWQKENGPVVPFGASAQVDLLKIAAQIRTFTERIEEEGPLDEMRSAMAEAQNVVFLGFAFHRQNMKLIAPPAESRVQQIFATTLGIPAGDLPIVGELIDRALQPIDGNLQKQFLPGTCTELLTNFRLGLTA